MHLWVNPTVVEARVRPCEARDVCAYTGCPLPLKELHKVLVYADFRWAPKVGK